MSFHQTAPTLPDPWSADPVLAPLLRRLLPAEVYAAVAPDLHRLALRMGQPDGDVWRLGEAAEAAPPRHVPYDAWGRRIDRIETAPAWAALDAVAAEEGLVAAGYERRWGGYSRLEQMARLYLFHPASAVYSCPLAMTDGAARVLELHGDAELRAGPLRHLTSRDPADVWTSGQWMTERTGGSDVSGTSTVARCEHGVWRLHGVKWFTSATTSQMALTLARPEHAAEGSGGLSLFLVELRDDAGTLQGIRVERLKDKLGTKALPTAELTLAGAPARLVGGEGHGVRKIAAMLGITRLYNAVCAAAGMRRAVGLARDYAARRTAFGRALLAHPAHAETLAELEVEAAAAAQLTFRAAELLGREETGSASEAERALLRLLVPVVKLYTGKQAVAVASEALEAFGGAGYVEDTGLPRLLRDAQVLSIWEGTTNVLALDVLRALARGDGDPLGAWLADVDRRATAAVTDADFADAGRAVRRAARAVTEYARAMRGANDPAGLEAGARGFAYAIARVTAAALLIDQARWARDAADPSAAHARAAAHRWCRRDLAPLGGASPEEREEVGALVEGC